MLKLIKKSNQAGVTLLETILVLSLIAIIMIGGLNLYKNASSASKTIEAQRQIVSLATNIESLYNSQGGYGNGVIDVSELYAAGAIPGGMVDVASDGSGGSVTRLYSIFGTEVTITGFGGTFEIEYLDIPQDVCIKLLTGSIGARSVAVSSGGTDLELPLSISDAIATPCSDTNANDLYITF